MEGTELMVITPETRERIDTEVNGHYKRAAEVTINSPCDYTRAGQYLIGIKTMRQKIAQEFAEAKAKTYDAWKTVVALEKRATEPLDRAEAILKPKLIAWQEEVEAERRKQEAALQEKQRKDLETAQKKADKEMEKGNTEKAQAIMENAVTATPPAIEPIIKVEGISTRYVWKARVVDEVKVPRKFWTIDLDRLDKFAKATNGLEKVPGVQFYSVPIMSASRRG